MKKLTSNRSKNPVKKCPMTGLVILAAGKGTRMKSPLPKVLHVVAGQPLLFHLLDRVLERETAQGSPQDNPSPLSICLVVGHGREQVITAVGSEPRFRSLSIDFVEQVSQLGTGDAVRTAITSPWGLKLQKADAEIAVLPGDTPLVSAELLDRILAPLAKETQVRLVTTRVPAPHGLGRILRAKGRVVGIVEEKDASPVQRTIGEVNTSVYKFRSAFLAKYLGSLTTHNAQKEYYLTDLVAIAAKARGAGRKSAASSACVEGVLWERPEDVMGINDPWELAQVNRLARDRLIERLGRAGVLFADPQTTWLDAHVKIAAGVEIGQGVILRGATQIEEGARIGPYCVLTDAKIGRGTELRAGVVIQQSQVGAGASLGPYAHLRPESQVGEDVKIGNFVELKKAKIGSKSSVAHLSYLGDAEVGERVNIGCGFVTCNYDGRVIDGSRKHKTIIEDDVFMGSDCQTVAPVRVRKGAFVASGSTITREVESDALAIARAPQVNKPGYAKKLRAR